MYKLALFNLKRKIINKHSIVFSVLTCLIICLLLFIDIPIEKFSLFENNLLIETKGINEEAFLGINDFIQINQESDILIEKVDSRYFVISNRSLNNNEIILLELAISNYESLYNENFSISYQMPEEKTYSELIILLITGLYFILLAYATGSVADIMSDKQTNTIEYLCTVITPKKYFISRIISTSLYTLYQIFHLIPSVIFSFFLRQKYDNGKGLLQFLYKMGWIHLDCMSFRELYRQLNVGMDLIIQILLCVGFIFIGFISIQIIALLIASKAKNMEEVSSIQGPLYICLLFIYYLSLYLQSYIHYDLWYIEILSLVPILSILLFPMKMISGTFKKINIFGSYLYALLFVLLLVRIGKKRFHQYVFENGN